MFSEVLVVHQMGLHAGGSMWRGQEIQKALISVVTARCMSHKLGRVSLVVATMY